MPYDAEHFRAEGMLAIIVKVEEPVFITFCFYPKTRSYFMHNTFCCHSELFHATKLV